MAYVFAFSPCLRCGRTFGYNPYAVPSSRADNGEREPICRPCFDYLNRQRTAIGLPPIPLLPDAYEPADEDDELW
jgi:hypothetical protein